MSVHACTARDQVDKRKRQEKKLCALAPVDTIGSLGRMAYLKWVARISETHKTITDFDRYQSSMLHD
jgi:hypothetical protein